MEFKYRAVDDRPPPPQRPLPPCPSASRGDGFFTEQAPLRAAYPAPNFYPNQYRNDMGEWILREIEKDRIREEIISGEILRRRMLEAEVRKELMMEREMVMRREMEMGGDSSFDRGLSMHFNSRIPYINNFENQWLEERIAFARHGNTSSVLPPMPQSPDAAGSKVKASSEVNNNKDRLIVMARPNPNMAGSKRKAVTPTTSDAGERPVSGFEKKFKEEWSCVICQVSATSESAFNAHLQGKKHKAKEARLRSDILKTSNGPLPKKTRKPSKPMETDGTSGSLMEKKVHEEPLHQSKTGDDSNQTLENWEDANVKRDESTKCSKSENTTARVERVETAPKFKKEKKFKFWCEMCKTGAYSEIVMESHKNGKKHRSRLQQLGQNGETKPYHCIFRGGL